MTDPARPMAGLSPARADALRAAIGNARLEGWAPTPRDVGRLAEVAGGAVTPDAYLDGAVARAHDAAREIGPPDCIDDPATFPDTVYPGTRILRNRFGIRDADALRQLEFETGTLRGYLIDEGRYPIEETFDGAHLVAIHRAMLGVVYPWAGAFRRYDMALHQTTFHAVWIDRYLADATRLLRGALRHPGGAAQWVTAASEIYAYLNCAHPFREGNGRSSKTLLQLAARRSGLFLDYERVSKSSWDGASRRSAPDYGHYRPDSHMLRPVFRSLVTEPVRLSDLRGN